MGRVEEVLKFVDFRCPGIEIAPYFSPMIPKAKHSNAFTLDVFSTAVLREKGKEDPNVKDLVENIEEVDFVGDACGIDAMLRNNENYGQFQYIVSSHNFEHLPNPIKFLIGCSRVLRPGGYISMAIPDHRACFDHFRFPTKLSDWLLAYHGEIEQPSPEVVFDFFSNHSAYTAEGDQRIGCDFASDNPDNFELTGDVVSAYEVYKHAKQQDQNEYQDAHCSVLTNTSFELLVSDLIRIGLVDLEVVEVSDVRGLEFFVHLRKPEKDNELVQNDTEVSRLRREDQLREVSRSLGAAGFPHRSFDASWAEREAVLAERDRLASELRNVVRYPWKNFRRFLRRA
ncbi:methyltransferase domain-containing protein [uncultured Ruegeria sp.]|uniref:methyltransferase domain-containing protein n=1 Tax=uncultured Ruegeria sp. TaxID=259304 RepID=UPI0026152C03|nr:methyltransferase domain-containing protein [uncultured Ruegeria sp.]